ncbi:phosphopyruvate hydratase [Candidatus Micrarchaeota archaeon]|nr:phosphopyruvate hydratase [Candidatus Micrarchaeota archaeon]
MKIVNGTAREILDSRGNPTVEVEIFCDNGRFVGRAPSGASTGIHEAVELRDGDENRYGGKGVIKAVKNAMKIIAELRDKEFTSPRDMDLKIIDMDGTRDKSNLGANATTAVSMAIWKAFSDDNLYSYDLGLGLRNDDFMKRVLPIPMMNIINGGKHAGNGLAVQEFMIVPYGADSFKESLRFGAEIYHELGKMIKNKYGRQAINVGDEGGYAPNLSRTDDALSLIANAVDEMGYSDKVKLAIDVAASSFYDKKTELYSIDGRLMNRDELIEFYLDLAAQYPLVSIEDPFDEDDFDGFAMLLSRINAKAKEKHVQVVGDDLTTTNPERVRKAIDNKSMSALLLKVNQIGTVTEALESVKLCYDAETNIIVSHRSGETIDTFIADLAVALNSGWIKTGAPARGERVAKYNRLMEIEAQLGDNAIFADKE